MKKILFITTISGFLPQFEMNDVNIVQELGYEVHYATNFYNPVYEVNREELRKHNIILHQIDIQKSPFKVRRNFKAWMQLRKILKKEHIDIIHCHNPMGGVLGRLADIGLKRKLPVIYTAHGFHFYKGAPALNWLLYYPVEVLLARKTNVLITINDEDYIRASKFRLRPGGVVRKIPGVGISTAKFRMHTEERECVRKELGISEQDFFLLSVGELNANKNHQIVVHDNNYFNDLYQGIPIGGYTKMVANMLKDIPVQLKTDYFEKKEEWDDAAGKVVFTGMIDEYFNYCFGELEYRSLRFETETLNEENFQGNAVVNYTEYEVPYTRIIEHKHFEFACQNGSDILKTVVTREYPITWKRGDEPYYPMNDDKNNTLYAKYRDLADKQDKVIFGGRLGMYKYLDMHQVIETALECVNREFN